MSHQYRNLCFEGGGVRGIAYGGALNALDNMGILPSIQRVAGTSAGAITATALAIGYSAEEASDLIASTNFKEFEDRSNLFQGIWGLFRENGWFKGEVFRDWMGQLIKQKTGSENLTFGELDEAINGGEKNYRHLYVVATNLSAQRAEVFSHEKHPKERIKDTVRMSMSIPIYFRSVKKSNNIFVDGGVTYNFPIDLFDHERYLHNPANKGDYEPDDQGHVFNYETLGFRLDSKKVITHARDDWNIPPIEVKNVKQFALGLVNYMMEMANRAHLLPEDWNRTIFIDALGVKPTDFDLSEARITALQKSGERSVEDYFHWRDEDEHWGSLPK